VRNIVKYPFPSLYLILFVAKDLNPSAHSPFSSVVDIQVGKGRGLQGWKEVLPVRLHNPGIMVYVQSHALHSLGRLRFQVRILYQQIWWTLPFIGAGGVASMDLSMNDKVWVQMLRVGADQNAQ